MCCLRWGERQLGLRDKPFRESIPYPIRPLPTLRTARYRDARRAGRGSRERRNSVLGEVFGPTVEPTMSLPACPGAGYELIEGHRCASTARRLAVSISLPSAPDNQLHA